MESIGVYWINLKPHLLPCIVSEVDHVVAKHRSILPQKDSINPQPRSIEFFKRWEQTGRH